MPNSAPIPTYLQRVVRRPRPWIVRYLLLTLPSVVLAALIAIPLGPYFRTPLWIEALETRSLDGLVEALTNLPELSGAPLWGIALPALPLVWLGTRLLWILTEGGVLVSYAEDDAPGRRGFVAACRRWFGSFLLLSVLGTTLTLLSAALVAVVAGLVATLSVPLGFAAGVVGILLLAVMRLWLELGRAAAVARDDRHVVRALRHGGRLLARRPLALIGLAVATMVLRLLLVFGSRRLTPAVPQRWWLLTLVVQQVLLAATLAPPLVRKAGEIGWARAVFDDTPAPADV